MHEELAQLRSKEAELADTSNRTQTEYTELQENFQLVVLENETLKRENEIIRRKSNESNDRPLIEAAQQINVLKLEVINLQRQN